MRRNGQTAARRAAPIAALLLAAAMPALLGGQEAFEKAGYDYVAAITIEGAAAGGGLARVALTPEVFDLAAPDFSDLRVVSSAGAETGYVVRIAEETIDEKTLPVRLYNRTSTPGKQCQATADFGAKILKHRIEIETPGTNFRRGVLVEGSDDGAAWQKVRGGVFLFRVAAEGGAGTAFDKRFVEIPPNDQQYLRITVAYDPEEPREVAIDDVRAWQVVATPPGTAPVPVAASGAAEKKGVTEITLDAGRRNMPLYRLALRFADESFYRRATVYGRNEERRVETAALEGGRKKDTTVEVPWTELATHALYRITAGGEVEESTTMNLAGARFRYLKVAVENGNDAPLAYKGLELTRLAAHVDFKTDEGQSYALYLGRSGAQAPRYDLSHYAGKLAEGGVAAATLGPVRKNPDRAEPQRQVPLSERYRGLIWLALLALVAVMALLVYRMVRSRPGPGA